MNRYESASYKEGAASASTSTSTPTLAGQQRLGFYLVVGGILLALALVVIPLRFHRLSEIPPGIVHDEAVDGELALQVLQGKHAVFFPVDQGREALAIYTLALSISLLGQTSLAMRLPTALGSAGLVFAVFWLGWTFFGRDESGRATALRGLLIGGVAAGLQAVSLGQTVLGRTAYNKITHMPLLLALCLVLLWQGWRQRCGWRIALAGICAGLLPYTYIPARFTPFLFLLFGLSFLPLRPPLAWSRIQAALPRTAVFLCAAGLVAAPILVHFALHPEHFFLRSRHISIFDPSRSQSGLLWTFVVNMWEHLLVFGVRGDRQWRHTFSAQPMLNPGEAIFFWLGVGMTVWRWQRPAYRLLLLWLVLLLLPAALSNDFSPNTMRMMGATPAVYLLAGVGVWEAFRFLTRKFPRINTTLAAAAILCSVILFQGVFTYRAYFQEWATAPEVYNAYRNPLTELAWTLNALPSAEAAVYLIPHAAQSFMFTALYQSQSPARIMNPTASDTLHQIKTWLATMEDATFVKVVDWPPDAPWAGDGDENIILLMDKYGRRLGSDAFATFQIHTYTDIALERPWTFYEYLEPRTVQYDGGLSLRGFALGQGKNQLSAQEGINLGKERALWLALQWQTNPGLPADYAISLRLYNREGARFYQKDHVLGDSTHARTRHWSADEPVDTLFHLDLPMNLPPGDYELRLIVYDADTLRSTVEVGVWEPETVLARLQWAGGK